MNLFQNNQNFNNYGSNIQSNIQILQMNNLQNNNSIQKINEENEKLKEEIQRLKDINKDLNNELNILRNNIQNLKNENNKMRLSNINQSNQINEINNLKQIISQKDKEIKELKLKLKKNVDMNDIMVINFLSTDQLIRCGIPCLLDDTFADVEEKLYQQFNEYRDTNNIFLFKGRTILRFKKVRENNICNGDTIQIIKPEENNN